jgi:hypothetical protein
MQGNVENKHIRKLNRLSFAYPIHVNGKGSRLVEECVH